MTKLPGFEDKEYWGRIKQWAKDHKSDGCTGVKDFYVESCHEHDYHYRYGVTLYGDPISFCQANARLRQVIQMKSKLRWFSPVSWGRYLGTTVLGITIWNGHRKRNLKPPMTNPEQL
jgi:hypothetical protein